MKSSDFFGQVQEGMRVGYGGRIVRINFIGYINKFAFGIEEGSRRAVTLVLVRGSGLLRDRAAGDFEEFEILPEKAPDG